MSACDSGDPPFVPEERAERVRFCHAIIHYAAQVTLIGNAADGKGIDNLMEERIPGLNKAQENIGEKARIIARNHGPYDFMEYLKVTVLKHDFDSDGAVTSDQEIRVLVRNTEECIKVAME